MLELGSGGRPGRAPRGMGSCWCSAASARHGERHGCEQDLAAALPGRTLSLGEAPAVPHAPHAVLDREGRGRREGGRSRGARAVRVLRVRAAVTSTWASNSPPKTRGRSSRCSPPRSDRRRAAWRRARRAASGAGWTFACEAPQPEAESQGAGAPGRGMASPRVRHLDRTTSHGGPWTLGTLAARDEETRR